MQSGSSASLLSSPSNSGLDATGAEPAAAAVEQADVLVSLSDAERQRVLVERIFALGSESAAAAVLSPLDQRWLMDGFRDAEQRKRFSMQLNQQRAVQKRLDSAAFDTLVDVLRAALRACEASGDFAVAKNLVNMAATFFRGEGSQKEYLQSQLRDETLLHNVHLWEELFFDQVAAEKRRMEAGLVFSSLSSDEQREAIVRFQNVVFGQLGTYVFNMLECGVDPDNVREFARKMCAASELSADDEAQLMDSIGAAAAPAPSAQPALAAVGMLLSGVPAPADVLGAAMTQVSDTLHPSVRRAVARALLHAGRVDMTDEAFGQLCALVGVLLGSCELCADFGAAAAVARAAPLLVCRDMALDAAVCAHAVWADPRLWRAALHLALEQGADMAAALQDVQRQMDRMHAPPATRRSFLGRAASTSVSERSSLEAVVAFGSAGSAGSGGVTGAGGSAGAGAGGSGGGGGAATAAAAAVAAGRGSGATAGAAGGTGSGGGGFGLGVRSTSGDNSGGASLRRPARVTADWRDPLQPRTDAEAEQLRAAKDEWLRQKREEWERSQRKRSTLSGGFQL